MAPLPSPYTAVSAALILATFWCKYMVSWQYPLSYKFKAGELPWKGCGHGFSSYKDTAHLTTYTVTIGPVLIA